MDAPKDVGQRNIAAAEEGGQQQMHDDKPHKQPMLKKVRDKMKKIRNTITGHGHGNGAEHEQEQEHETGGSSSIDMDEDDAALREDEMEKGGHQEDVEDKRAMDSGPELHGAPMYDSETIPSAAKDVERNDDPGVRLGDLGGQAARKDVERNDDPGVRLGDLGGQAAAKGVERNDDPAVRYGDLGGQAAAKGGERNDDPAVRLGDLGGLAAAKAVECNDDPAVRLRDLGGQAAAKGLERNDDPGVRLGDLGCPVVEDPAAPHSKTPTPRGGEDIGTTDVVRDFQAMTVSDDPKQAGAEKMDRDQVKETEAMPVSDGAGEEWTDAPTDAAYTGSYTDSLKNTAAGTTEYDKNLASTVYEKVAGVGTVVASKAQQVTPGFGAGGNSQDDSGTTEPMAVDAGKRDLDLPKEGTPASYPGTEELKNASTDATTEGAPAATYTDMIKSAAAGTTEYGMQLASSVYGKVAGVGTAMASRVMPSSGTASPDIGAQDGSAAATDTPGAVTSLAGGNLVSETVQPTTEGNIGGGVAAEGPTLRGDEIEAPRTNTNVM